MLGNMGSRVIWAIRFFYDCDHGIPPPNGFSCIHVHGTKPGY